MFWSTLLSFEQEAQQQQLPAGETARSLCFVRVYALGKVKNWTKLTFLQLCQYRLYVGILHHIKLRSTRSLCSRFCLEGGTLTCFTTHYCYVLAWNNSRFLLLVWHGLTLLNAVTWLVHVTLLGSCWSSHYNTRFAVADRSFIANFLRWLLVHRVCYCFTCGNNVYVSWLGLFILVNQLDRINLVLVYANLLFLVLRYQIAKCSLVKLIRLRRSWFFKKSTASRSWLL